MKEIFASIGGTFAEPGPLWPDRVADMEAIVFITHRYLGQALGGHKLLVFLVFLDYIEMEHEFAGRLEGLIERTARDLGSEGAVVMPFAGDVDATRSDVLAKPWRDDELAQVRFTPSLLVIDKDFDDFSPRQDSWALFSMGRSEGPAAGPSREAREDAAEAFLRILVDIANSEDGSIEDVVVLAADVVRERPRLGKIFRVSPSVFGVSVDIVSGINAVARWWETYRLRTGHSS